MTRQELERFSEEFACGVAVVELALGRSIWRLCGCSLVGSMRKIRFGVAVRSLMRRFEERVVFWLEASGRRNE